MTKTCKDKKSCESEHDKIKSDIKNKAIAIIQEISDSPTCHIVQSRFLDNVIEILKEKL